MKFGKLALLILATALFAASCSDTAAPPNANTQKANQPAPTATANTTAPDEWAAARKDYTQFCSNCHKMDGAGGELKDESGTLKVPSFKGERAANEPDAEYIEQIKEGGDGMPAYKSRLDDGRVKALVAFIRHEFQGKDVKPPAPAALNTTAPAAPNTTVSAAPNTTVSAGPQEKGEKKDDDDKKK